MSRNLTAAASLADKYAVGEVADISGQASYFDATTSKWMQSNTWIPGASLPSGVKAALRAGAYGLSALTDNSLLLGNNYPYLQALTPLAKNATVVAIPHTNNGAGTICKCMTINSGGASIVTIGQTGGYASMGSVGGGHLITSDGTTLWSWTAASASAFGAFNSTDGVTWSSASLTGQATFTALTGQSIGPSSNQPAGKLGENFAGTSIGVAAYCGARHLLIGRDGSGNCLAQRSTTGLSWGGDETTTILGSTTIAPNSNAWWYRNGNTFFITIGTAIRKSTDGGATWGNATNAIASASTTYYRINASDATRLAGATSGGTSMAFSADSGATWTARTAPLTLTANCTLSGRGSSWVLCDTSTNITYKTTDDGATWSLLASPSGFAGGVQGVFADANRWYMFSAIGNQVATSTDLSTWTVRNVSNAAPGITYNTYGVVNMAATDSNTIMGVTTGSGHALSSIDGGVTWAWSTYSSDATVTGAGANLIIANTVGSGAFISQQVASSNNAYVAYVMASDLVANGKVFRASSATIGSPRTNATAYVRVA